MKLVGVDYGRRRIGVAVSDENAVIARSLCVIDRKKSVDCVDELLRIIDDEKASALIFGLPLGTNDNETEMSQEVREFASLIVKQKNIPIHFVDESYTSVEAAELKMHRKKKARRDKSLSDRIAACLILQRFIDHGF